MKQMAEQDLDPFKEPLTFQMMQATPYKLTSRGVEIKKFSTSHSGW